MTYEARYIRAERLLWTARRCVAEAHRTLWRRKIDRYEPLKLTILRDITAKLATGLGVE